MGIFSFLKPKKKAVYQEGKGLELIRSWAASDDTVPNNPISLISAYKNLVYACASKNAYVMSRQKLHLYMMSPKGYKSKSFPGFAIRDKTYRNNILDRAPAVIKSEILYSADSELSEITDHPFLELFYRPNNDFAYTEFLQLSDLFMELTGNNYWHIAKNSIGIPKALYILPSQNITPILGKTVYIKEYKYTTSHGIKNIKPLNIFHCRFPNPANIPIGVSPLSACVDSVNLDTYALKYAAAIFKNMGALSGYFHTKDNLNESSFNRLSEQLKKYKGYSNAGQTPLLDNGVEFTPISVSPQMLFDSLITKKTDKDIARAFGVPISMIDVEDVNKANAETGSNTYEEQTIDPRNRLFSDKINQSIIPLYPQREGVKIFCAFDNPAKEDNSFILKKQIEFVKWGICSPNEVRKEEGRPDRVAGDNYYTPVNYMMVDNNGNLIIPGDYNGNNDSKSEKDKSWIWFRRDRV